ncbi:MAG: UDP-N-acetylmuramyl peptide synthase [Methanobrevibacter sp.]|nr:UDP-N-acetylmuramyl peptide synthase [Methanobrevibacter sp.]
MEIQDLVDSIGGELYGNDDFFSIDGFTGKFTFLNDSHTGDIVIRHWINDTGIQMAFNKNIACLITKTPKDGAIEMAEKLNFPLIVTDKIELANAYALSHTIDKYSPNSTNVVITGTNGKSTTSHLIYHILKNAGFHVLTNTDSESEFNTLIDPMVSKLIFDEVTENGAIDYLVIEVSEVQGWLGNLMENHAALMSAAVNPEVGVITNIAMDHIGLVNSIEDVFNEISTVPKAIGDGICVLNHDDELVMKLDVENPFYTSMSEIDDKNAVYYNGNEIVYESKPILAKEELPFTGSHFIQNILSAIGATISLGLDIDVITEGVKSYKALNRRFAKLNDEPLIYDDFAHNPDGIKATISETKKLLHEGQTLYVVCSIRGSRGIEINQLNVEALAESMDDNIELILSSSNDVVNELNFVEPEEREVFFNTLNEKNIEFTHYDNLKECLSETYKKADKKDIILLIGAQGMDPAESLLKDII